MAFDSSHYYRQWWYWGGEAALRVDGEKMQLTSIPDEEWQQVEDAARSLLGRNRRRVGDQGLASCKILKDYNATMRQAGRPYRYGQS